MAQVYKIDSKRYQYTTIDSAVVTTYILSEADYNKWLKFDTTTTDIDITLSTGLREGFKCIVENIGTFTINYLPEVGTTIATQQGAFTEDQFRTVEIAYNNTEWRLQGFIGRNDISSLFDVNTTAFGGVQDGDVMTYDLGLGSWIQGRNPLFIPRDVISTNYILEDSDNGKILPFDTTIATIDVALNLGLTPGFNCRLLNVGTGTLNIISAVNLFGPSITSTQYTKIDLFHSNLETYYSVL